MTAHLPYRSEGAVCLSHTWLCLWSAAPLPGRIRRCRSCDNTRAASGAAPGGTDSTHYSPSDGRVCVYLVLWRIQPAKSERESSVKLILNMPLMIVNLPGKRAGLRTTDKASSCVWWSPYRDASGRDRCRRSPACRALPRARSRAWSVQLKRE